MNLPFLVRRLATGLLFAFVCPLSVVPARAQERYISLGFGTSQTARSDMTLRGFPAGTDARFGGVTWRNEPFVGTPYYVLKFGGYFKRQPRLGVEFDFTHDKAIARTEQNVRVTGTYAGSAVDAVEPLRNKVETVRFTNGVNILSLVALYRFADGDDRWQPYVGLGPSYYLVWSRNTVDGAERYTRYRGAGWGWTGQAGIRYRLNRNNLLYAELKYTSGPARAKTRDDGEIATRLRAFHQTFGFAYRW
jgi:hypothetical protein